jgi:hypothetical protein
LFWFTLFLLFSPQRFAYLIFCFSTFAFAKLSIGMLLLPIAPQTRFLQLCCGGDFTLQKSPVILWNFQFPNCASAVGFSPIVVASWIWQQLEFL